MSFSELKVAELRKIADEFAVELRPSMTKDAIIAEFGEMGVTYEMYETFANARAAHDELAKEENVPTVESNSKPAEGTILVKMERENGTYETYGYKFTKAHPFLVVKASDADRICRTEQGFRIALPSEAAEFYG